MPRCLICRWLRCYVYLRLFFIRCHTDCYVRALPLVRYGYVVCLARYTRWFGRFTFCYAFDFDFTLFVVRCLLRCWFTLLLITFVVARLRCLFVSCVRW